MVITLGGEIIKYMHGMSINSEGRLTMIRAMGQAKIIAMLMIACGASRMSRKKTSPQG